MPKGVFVRSEAHCLHLSESRKHWWANQENRNKWLRHLKEVGFRKGISNPSKGKTYEEVYGVEKANELREIISKTAKERYENNLEIRSILEKGRIEGRTLQGESMKKIWQDLEFRKRRAESRRKFLESEEAKEYRNLLSQKMSNIKKKHWADENHTYNTKEYRKKLSDGTIQQWRCNEYAIRWMKANARRPNNQEISFSYLLRHTCPHMFRYNGDARLGIVFGGKIPDFVNINGGKQVIEFLGTWWHGEKRTGRTKEEEENRLIKHYKKFGFRCLPVWEIELNDKVVLKQKVMGFINA